MLVALGQEFVPVFHCTTQAAEVDVIEFFVGPGVFYIVDLEFTIGWDPRVEFGFGFDGREAMELLTSLVE